MRKMYLTCLAVFFLSFSSTATAASWHYDFEAGEDVSQLQFVNPTGVPTFTINGDLEIYVPGNAAYDLCSWVNKNAPRVYRNVANEAFTLETKMGTSATTYTFLSGLFLYDSADGISANDLIFGASSNSMKLENGAASNHNYPFNWRYIGAYSDLYLQVVHDGSGNYDFNYKFSAADPWALYASVSGYSFDYLGVITKTWYNPSAGIYPTVTADFDYLNYNYQVPIPGAVWLLGSGFLGLLGLKRRFCNKT